MTAWMKLSHLLLQDGARHPYQPVEHRGTSVDDRLAISALVDSAGIDLNRDHPQVTERGVIGIRGHDEIVHRAHYPVARDPHLAVLDRCAGCAHCSSSAAIARRDELSSPQFPARLCRRARGRLPRPEHVSPWPPRPGTAAPTAPTPTGSSPRPPPQL